DELNWKKQVLIAAVYGLCANPACIAYAPAIPDIAMMIANKLENFGVTSDERLPDF
ncbi:TPA: exodeoxyribonuclease VIII, partial [Shigella flexneri]|nr:exodeoxyribonuclease VIII [Shigella flexneri]